VRAFVACWFFPPAVSSEGIVTYKLLRNSRHSYDVCSSLSKQWGYNQTLPLQADNITPLTVDTDSLDEWVDECVRIFEERHAANPYDAVMTRSMPPESIEVGKRIHEAHPELPWIASIADPIAKSPYDINAWIVQSDILNEPEKKDLAESLRFGIDGWRNDERPEVIALCKSKDIEDYAVNNATALIFPHEALKRYVLGSRRRKNAYVVHHSFDRSMYPVQSPCEANRRIKLTFTGHSDIVRTLEPLVRALHRTRTIDEFALDKLEIQLIGHVNREVKALIYNYDLYDCITIVPDEGYFDTLQAMSDSDWLVHVDANFDFLEEEGGSVYFAGKIADYLGTDRPLFAITGTHSPAYGIVTRAGGLCFEPADINGMAEALVDIANGALVCKANAEYRARFDAVNVAERYDKWMEELVTQSAPAFNRTQWPVVPNLGACQRKFLSICVPAYNVQCFLDRCLMSMVSSPVADQLEIIVVDDGSPDNSAQIALAYQEQYPTIVRVIRKENGGHGSTINAALAAATGIFFRVVDGDDWVDGDSLASLINRLRGLDELPDLVTSSYDQVYMESGEMVPLDKQSEEFEDYVLYSFDDTDMSNEYLSIHSIMMKTELMRVPDFKIQEHTFYVDVEYQLFAIPYIDTVMFAPEHVYCYAVGNAEQSIDPAIFMSRYDHHDRVIRRMAAYYADNAETMGEYRRKYMQTLFVKHLLYTHYLLSLIWDEDKTRGFARAKDFDEFLKRTAPDLHAEFGKAYPVLMALRTANFDPAVAPRPKRLDGPDVEGALRRAANAIERVPLGGRIVNNQLLRSIAFKIAGRE